MSYTRNYKIHTLKFTYLCFLHFILPVFNTFNALFQSEKPLVFMLYEESVRFLRIMCSQFLKAECYKNDEFDKFKNPSMILPNNNIEIGHETRKILISCKNDANYNKFMNVIIFFYQKVVENSLKRLLISGVARGAEGLQPPRKVKKI
uniref:Uncharacterized protein n=1 Tax=Schizaphis graminum TaxID=13262 RepID=A0A2S2PFJ4_SCHGA